MASGTWAVDASGNWSTSGNWSGGTIADGATFTANFTNNISATRTVTIDTVRTIGNITFSDNGAAGSAWVLSGANALTLDNGGAAPVLNVITASTISGPLAGTEGFTKAGTGDLNINGATKTLSGTVTLSAGNMNLNTPATGSPNQLDNVTTFNLANSTSFLVALGNATTTFPQAFTGSGFIQANLGTAQATFSGDLSGFTGFLGAYAVNITVPYVFSTAQSFPAQGSTYADTNGNGANTTFIYRYTGAGAVSTTGQNVSFFRTSNGTSSITTEFDNASSNGALVTYGGEFKGMTTPFTSFTGGTHTVRYNASAGDIAVTGNILAGSVTTRAVTKTGAFKTTLSGANTYTGTTSVSAGTLSAQSAGAFGTSGAVTQTGGTIDVSGGVALTKTGAAFTLISAAGANALTTTTGTNTLACAGITLSSTIIVDAAAGASLTVNNTAAMSGAFGITKNNSGEIGLGTFANTYTGAVTINAGTLTVGNLQNTSTASSLGTGALSSAIALTGTLKYNGTGHSTNRSLTFTGAAPALDASGSGAVTYSAATQAAGARTITFTGSSTAANTLSAALSDGTGAVSVAKSGAGKWVLSNATLNYTGTTSVSDGTLNLGSTNRTLSGALSVSGGTVENSTNTISANTTMTGGTITAQLTGNKTLDVTSGSATLQPVNNVNDFSGNTTVAAGATLKLITGLNPSLGSGRVLGTSNVSVSGNLRTDGSVTQKGQMRYGGNLTFQAGAKLYVGSLA